MVPISCLPILRPRAGPRRHPGPIVSDHKPVQHRITLHGRELHFVAYEGVPANAKRKELAIVPTWYLMSEGKRHPVMEHQIGQPLAEIDIALRQWAEENAFGSGTPRRMQAALRRHTADLSPRS